MIRYRPVKRAFLGMRLLTTAIGLMAFTIAAIVAAMLLHPAVALLIIVFLAIAGYEIADAMAAYKKQRYEFGADTVYYGDGHLFTNRDTELRFANVTHVRVIKPFIEYHLFGTGTIIIESAGSSDAAVEMRAIKQPYEAFRQIRNLLAKDTFSLTYSSLLSQKKPSPLAVMLQLAGGVLAAIGFVLLGIGATTVASIISGMPVWLLLLLLPIIAAAGLGYLWATYQDQLRREYYVYSDVIHYSKGFLTKREAFMPAGNLANARLTQNFIGKLLNLQDVVVSCQGQGSEINFANLHGGENMQRAITGLINKREALKSDEPARTEPEANAAGAVPRTKSQIVKTFTAAPTPKGADPSAQDLYMDITRAIAPTFILIFVPPAFVLALIAQYITAKRTVYRLTDGGVASYYTFLSTTNVEFSRDKITGLVIKRDPFDRFFGTCTVTFWSIGSGASVDFKNIAYDENVENLMRAKAGIIDDETLETISPQFGIANFYKANVGSATLSLIIFIASILLAVFLNLWFIAVSIVLVTALVTVFIILHRRYARAWLRLGRHTTALNIGILFHKRYFARHDHIKDITLTTYPFSGLGTIQFNVAGERVPDSSQDSRARVPNRFSAAYIPGIAAEVTGQRSWLDQVLLHKPAADKCAEITSDAASTPEAVHTSRPALKNSLAVIIPLHVIIFPLIIILPFTILLRRYWLRRVEYRLEHDRVLMRWGVIYRKQHSIILARLDYTETGQGFLNKAFKNGTLYLYTAGSSNVELTLRDLPDYTEFYEKLKAYDKSSS